MTTPGRELRPELLPAESLDLDTQLFHFVVKRPLGHLQQLQGLIDSTVGTPQGKADEKAFDFLQDLIPGFFGFGPT
jgi:hypothetical protein